MTVEGGRAHLLQVEEEEKKAEEDPLNKELPEDNGDSGKGKGKGKGGMPSSNSTARLAEMRGKKGAGGAAAAEGELTVKESRSTGMAHPCVVGAVT